MTSKSNIYIFAWCLYYLQGTLYESGKLLSQVLMFLLIAVSLYYFVIAHQKYKLPSVLKILSVLLAIFSFYGVFIILFGNGVGYVSNYIYLKAIYMSLLPIFPFYVFTREGNLTDKALKIWVFVFLPVAIASFYRDQRESLLAAMEMNSSREAFTLNSGYILLAIVPLLAIYRKPVLRFSLLAVCLYFVLMGVKRGAILIGALCLVYSVFSAFDYQSSKKRFWILLLSAGLFLLAYLAFFYMLDTSDYFNARIEQTREGNTSGRDVIFSSLWESFIGADFFHFLFGSGADATLRVIGYAHNDWLEIAVNNGLIGLVLYFIYWYCIIKTFFRTKDSMLKQVIGMFALIYLTRTFFSMSYNDIPIYATSALGYALAMRDMKTQERLSS